MLDVLKEFGRGSNEYKHDEQNREMETLPNKILRLTIGSQLKILTFFAETMATNADYAKGFKNFGEGTFDLGDRGDHIQRVQLHTVPMEHPSGRNETHFHFFAVDRGVSWKSAQTRLAQSSPLEEEAGFYKLRDEFSTPTPIIRGTYE